MMKYKPGQKLRYVGEDHWFDPEGNDNEDEKVLVFEQEAIYEVLAPDEYEDAYSLLCEDDDYNEGWAKDFVEDPHNFVPFFEGWKERITGGKK
jgi:hypothetical protein